MSSRSARRRQAVNAAIRRKLSGPTQPALAPQPPAPLDDDGLVKAFDILNRSRSDLLIEKAHMHTVMRDSHDAAEVAAASARLLTNEADIALLDRRREALEGGALPLQPPTEADVARSVALSKALGLAIAANAKVAAIVQLTSDMMDLVKRLEA